MSLEQNFQQDISTKLKNMAQKIDEGKISTEELIEEINESYVTAKRNARLFIYNEHDR